MSENNVENLVLDAHPLITQNYSTLSKFADFFYTTPTIFNEIRDENARKNLALWGDNLKIRHPKPESIKRVTDFARLTGDYSVLSVNDLHIIALTFELEVELNNNEENLRKFPGEKLPEQIKREEERRLQREAEEAEKAKQPKVEDDGFQVVSKNKKRNNRKARLEQKERLRESAEPDEDGWQSVVKGWKQKPETEVNEELSKEVEELEINEEKVEEPNEAEIQEAMNKLDSLKIEEPETQETQSGAQDEDEDDDDGEWITSDNLIEEMIKDSGVNIEKQSTESIKMKVALATQDFAVQNTSLQLGLNLINILSGLRIKKVRNYMLRCHACFTMVPIPKTGQVKHFCPKCGGQTLKRCTVSVDSNTGKITPHLKTNFEWHTRGNKYSLASPLSKNSQKRFGNKGFVHNKSNKQKEFEEPILREDQKEYQKAVKDDDWLRRQNEKILNDYIGGGSADNFISPFVAQGYRSSGVKVGKGRFVNSSKRKK